MRISLLLSSIAIVVSSLTSVVSAFSPIHKNLLKQQQHQRTTSFTNTKSKHHHHNFITSQTTTTALNEGNQAPDYSGTGRGAPILALVLAGCLWFFTVPPEFRRTHICTSQKCVLDRAYCYDCKTVDELKQEVSAYYTNGGGIQWDFSVEQK